LVSAEEIIDLRFDYNMNLLQFVCHEHATSIFACITDLLTQEQRFKMADHRDSHLGSKAIHLAAASGDHTMIATLITKYNANCTDLTSNHQTVHHLAAQRYEGVASIFLMQRNYGVPVTAGDESHATALHFAAISLLIKNAQALIKLGADPNCQDIEGNTAIHLCMDNLFDEPQSFEKVKNFIKELIF
jgi:ankyrin repeat protein